MRRAVRALLLSLVALPALAGGIAVHDDRGMVVEMPRPALRIVSLAPFITELVYAAGAGDRLIAVTAYSDYPPAARNLPQVGDAVSLGLERLLALKPDLVIAWKSGNRPTDVTRLEQLGVPVLVVEAQRLDDIAGLLRRIGMAAGTTGGEKAAGAFETRLSVLRSRYAKARPVRVFLEIWHSPPMTVSGRHFASDAMAVCHGVNIFADAPGLAPQVSAEAVLAVDPEAIIGSASNETSQTAAENWRRFPEMRAVRLGAVFHVDPDLIQRQTPRILDGIEQICTALDRVRAGAVRATH